MPNEFPGLRMGLLGALLRQEQEKTPFEAYKLNLIRNENVFTEPTLSRIRHWARGKRIVVLDAHGVLMNRTTNIIYPHAGKIVQGIRDRGYTPVVWSYGGSGTDQILKRENWYRCLGMTIYNDNYYFPKDEALREFVRMTPQTPNRYKENPLRLKFAKNPDLFGGFTVVLDDNFEGHYPSGLLESQNHRFIPIVPHEADVIEQIGKRLTGAIPLGESVIERIDAAFGIRA